MGLRFDKPPPTMSRRLRHDWQRWLQASPPGHYIRENMQSGRFVGPIAVGSLDNYHPGGRGLAAAWRRVGWSFLMIRSEEAVGVVDWRVTGSARPEISSVRHAQAAALLMKALSCAEDVIAHRCTDYTVRYLVLPHLHTACLWLHAREPLFILMHESGETHQTLRIATGQELTAIMRRRTQELRTQRRVRRHPESRQHRGSRHQSKAKVGRPK